MVERKEIKMKREDREGVKEAIITGKVNLGKEW